MEHADSAGASKMFSSLEAQEEETEMDNSKQGVQARLRAKCGIAVGEKNSSLCHDGGRSRNRVPPGNKSSSKHRKTWEMT